MDMSDIAGFGRGMTAVDFSQTQSPVDPARIQSLFAKAAKQCKTQSNFANTRPQDSLEEWLAHSRSSSSESELGSVVANNLARNLADFLLQGGSLPPVANNGTGPSVLTFIDGLEFNYQLTEDDLHRVFARYGSVINVSISPDGSNAVVTFSSSFQASQAASELDGKQLAGFQSGFLRVVPYGWGNMNSNASNIVPLIRKYTCRFDIQIENDKEFHVARRIIGQKGSNMKRIVKQAGFDAKLRLRGRGSGFLEGSQKQESQEPLHLCVSCKEYEGYRSAVDQVEELLREIYRDFKDYCIMKAQPYHEGLRVIMQENPLLYQPGALDVTFSPPLTPVESGHLQSMAVEQLIEARNEARRTCNFKEADRIRDILKTRGIGLMDEPGGRGRGTEVTSWRVWR
jgi:hypothetical protein